MANPEQPSEPELPRPILPNIAERLALLRRAVSKAKTTELKLARIDLELDELSKIKKDGWNTFHELSERGALDDPDPFGKYDTELDSVAEELQLMRKRLILAEAEHTAPVEVEATRTPSPAFAAHDENFAPTSPKAPIPEVLDVLQLAPYLGISDSWIYKNYETEGIPHFFLGTQLRFRKEEIDAWTRERGKLGGKSDPALHLPPPVRRSGEAAKRIKEKKGGADILGGTFSPKGPDDPESALVVEPPPPNERTVKIVDELVPRMCARWFPTTEASQLRDWMLSNARGRKIEDRIQWNHDRPNLAMFIILCQHADILHLPTAKKKDGVGPIYAATLKKSFLLERLAISDELAEGIDRSHLRPLERQIITFESLICELVRTKIDPGRPWGQPLFSALDTYFGVIVGSPDHGVYQDAIKEACPKLVMGMLRIFYEIYVELPDIC